MALGWVLRGREAFRKNQSLHAQASHHVDTAGVERDNAFGEVEEMTKDMRELATQYRELHEDYEKLGATHKSTLLQVSGVEDELRVQQESARMERVEAAANRRKVGNLEGELRALQVAIAKAANRE
jgi:hypothetical protein